MVSSGMAPVAAAEV
nr:hypothetical protein [Tanacetum cinerariifolium]